MKPDAESPLPVAVQKILQAADGYMDLQMWPQAAEELEAVPAGQRDGARYAGLRYRLLAGMKNWAGAADAARGLLAGHPKDPAVWVNLAYATRRAAGIAAARPILLEALALFPRVAVIPFNLACYECQADHLELAERYLDQAFTLDATFRILARADEDLAPLWPKLAAT